MTYTTEIEMVKDSFISLPDNNSNNFKIRTFKLTSRQVRILFRMNYLLKALLTIFFLATSLAALDSRLERADNLYNNCHTDKSFLDEALALCNQVLNENSRDSEALWRMARLHMALAEDKPSKSGKLKVLETALDYADRARNADKSSADTHYWYGAILGRTAQEKGFINFLSQINEMKESFEKALELNPNHTGALHAMGIWYAEGSAFYADWKDEAESYLSRALRSDPNNTATYITIAKYYIREKQFEDARKALNTCLAVTNPTVPSEHYNYAKPEARRLLAEIEDK
jgi:tetratricopeptide (TPR) repeat protein